MTTLPPTKLFMLLCSTYDIVQASWPRNAINPPCLDKYRNDGHYSSSIRAELRIIWFVDIPRWFWVLSTSKIAFTANDSKKSLRPSESTTRAIFEFRVSVGALLRQVHQQISDYISMKDQPNEAWDNTAGITMRHDRFHDSTYASSGISVLSQILSVRSVDLPRNIRNLPLTNRNMKPTKDTMGLVVIFEYQFATTCVGPPRDYDLVRVWSTTRLKQPTIGKGSLLSREQRKLWSRWRRRSDERMFFRSVHN